MKWRHCTFRLAAIKKKKKRMRTIGRPHSTLLVRFLSLPFTILQQYWSGRGEGQPLWKASKNILKISVHLKLVTNNLTGTQCCNCRVTYTYINWQSLCRHTLVFCRYLHNAFSPVIFYSLVTMASIGNKQIFNSLRII